LNPLLGLVNGLANLGLLLQLEFLVLLEVLDSPPLLGTVLLLDETGIKELLEGLIHRVELIMC
jgi:hypothetical protein